MLKIVADENIPFLKGALEPYAMVTYLPGDEIKAGDVASADALITRTRTKCNASLLQGSNVRFIATATIGYDHIDTDYCRKNNIQWASAPGCNSSSVAQYIASLLLIDAHQNNMPLKGRTIGIVGVGNVGSKIARLAEIFGMRILLNDPPRVRREPGLPFVSLDKVLAESDYISLHVPLIRDGADKTRHLANGDFFQKLKRKPMFINTSRGEVADSDALKSALITKLIRTAVLDVWENEPDIDQELMGLIGYATPHIAGYSADGKANGTAMAVSSIAEFFDLPIQNFFPSDIPDPESPLDLSASKTPLYTAVTATYDIRKDNSALRNSPDDFEELRENYPLRREFPAYTIKRSANLNAEQIKALATLGFRFI